MRVDEEKPKEVAKEEKISGFGSPIIFAPAGSAAVSGWGISMFLLRGYTGVGATRLLTAFGYIYFGDVEMKEWMVCDWLIIWPTGPVNSLIHNARNSRGATWTCRNL